MTVPAEDRQDKLRLVTLLTLIRFPLVLLFFAGAMVYADNRAPWLFAASFAALVVSAVTDLFDGLLARRYGVETHFGAHVDPLMDKFFYLSTLPVMIYVATRNGHLGHASFLVVLTVLFLVRDQWVTFLRAIGSMYHVSGCANWAGKLRTALNFPLIFAIYYFEEAPASVQFIPSLALHVFEVVAGVVNLLSVYVYTRHYWPHLRRSATLEHRGTDPRP